MQPRPMGGVHDGRAADAVKFTTLIGELSSLPDNLRAGRECSGWSTIRHRLRLQSRPVLDIPPFIQPPWSRQTICIFVSARLQATAAPAAPAPMIRTSTGLFIPFFPLPLFRHSGAMQSIEPGISRFRVRLFEAPRNDVSTSFDDPHRHRADAADEIRIKPLRRARRSRSEDRAEDLLPEDPDLLLGEPVADAAMDAGPEREMLPRLGRSMMNSSARSILSSSRLPEMYHITTLSPLAIRRPASSTSFRAVRRMCSTGV